MEITMKQYYEIIYVVLVYKNFNDILDFLNSVKNQKNKKIIIVNSFYDEQTSKKLKK